MFRTTVSKFAFIFLFIFAMWAVFIAKLVWNFPLEEFSIYPRDFYGLRGVFLSVFVHYDFQHLISNTVPLFFLMSVLALFYEESFFSSILFIIFISNLLTWLLATSSFHLGASGLVYGLFSFIIVYSLMRRELGRIFVTLIVFCIYFISITSGLIPVQKEVSYTSHWTGFFCGVLYAIIENKRSKSLPTIARINRV